MKILAQYNKLDQPSSLLTAHYNLHENLNNLVTSVLRDRDRDSN